MDGVRFGRWFGEHRRQHGWPSQRALVAAAGCDPAIGGGVSADFVARLEAGALLHPFRGASRRRVLDLARLLCATPRELDGYLRAAALAPLTAEETVRVNGLRASLGRPAAPEVIYLPPRPHPLLGRDDLAHAITLALARPNPSPVHALVGPPGAGKSALAAEVLHRLAADPRRHALFPDGIAAIPAAGRHGAPGLIALLDDIADTFAPPAAQRGQPQRERAQRGQPPSEPHAGRISTAAPSASPSTAGAAGAPPGTESGAASDSPPDPGHALTRARRALAGRRALLLLDDLDPDLPLREALWALGHADPTAAGGALAGCVVLITSRAVPPLDDLATLWRVPALDPTASLALLTALIGAPLDDRERVAAAAIGTALGHTPAALRWAARARRAGIPLASIAAALRTGDIERALDPTGELCAWLGAAVDPLPPPTRERFLLLAARAESPFDFDLGRMAELTGDDPTDGPRDDFVDDPRLAAMVSAPADAAPERLGPLGLGSSWQSDWPAAGAATPARATAAAIPTAAHLTADVPLLMRHSLLERVDTPGMPAASAWASGNGTLPEIGAARPDGDAPEPPRYRVQPLLHLYAADLWRRRCADALEYADRYQTNIQRLESASARLLAAVDSAWCTGQSGLVVELVDRLTLFAGRLPNRTALRLVGRGVEASRAIGDTYHVARFLNRLAKLRFHRGDLAGAGEAWAASRELGERLMRHEPFARRRQLVRPWSGEYLLATAIGDYALAERRAQATLTLCEDLGDPACVADALGKVAESARLRGKLDDAERALMDIAALTRAEHGRAPTVTDRFDALALDVEVAHLHGDYEDARAGTETLLDLLLEWGDHYLLPVLLVELAEFAAERRRVDEARVLALRGAGAAAELEAFGIRARGMALVHRLAESPARAYPR